MTMIEKVKEAIAIKFAPAIDFKAPYAKVMLDMAAKAAIEAMREPNDDLQRVLDFDGYDGMIDAALKGM